MSFKKKLFENVKYSTSSQFLILLIGIAKTFVIPLILSISNYGYWQLYMFYITYIGFFSLGYNDGILLKYGKKTYSELPFSRIRLSMYIFIFMLILFSISSLLYAYRIEDPEKSYVMIILSASIPLYGISGVFLHVLLFSNKVKIYCIFSIVDAASSLFGAFFLYLFNLNSYHFLLLFTFFSKLLSVAILCILCREFLLGKLSSFVDGIKEFFDNIKTGIFLTFAVIFSMLLSGLGRIFIEHLGSIEDFAYYSFGITILNIFTVGISAISTALYPALTNLSTTKYAFLIEKLNDLFSFFCVIVLFSYFPAYFVVKIIFPNYAPVLSFLPILFVIILWQSNINILANTFCRVLRLEKKLLACNIIGVLSFILVTTFFLISSLSVNLLINISLSTFISLMISSILLNLIINKKVGIKNNKRIYTNLFYSFLFIFMNLSFSFTTSFVIISFLTCCYFIIHRQHISSLYSIIRKP